MVQIIDGKQNIKVTPGLPNTQGITLPNLTNLMQAKLDEGLLQVANALKTIGTSFVEDS
jgi:hypothetical protein